MEQDIVSKVKFSIYGHKRGWCFTQGDFLSFGSPVTIRKVLSRLEKDGFIRRVSRGIYDYPKQHATQGALPPDIEQAVQAITRRDQIKVMPSGAMAANLLGLSEQVPAKIVYLTEGLTKRVRIGKREIRFRKTTPKIMATADTFAGLAIQALRSLGPDHVDSLTLKRLQRLMGKNERRSIEKYARYAPAWIQAHFRTLLNGGARG